MAIGEQVTEQAKKMWSELTGVQKATLAAVLGIMIVAIFMLVWFANRTNYEPLYTNMEPKTANAYLSKLEEMNVDVKLADEGRTILVPAEDKYRLRIDLAGEVDVPGSVVGYEIFNNTQFGETDTDKRVKYLVALQGELTRTIEVINEVEAARVLIAVPQTSLFVRDEQEPTASVMLKLKPYTEIKPEQVKSIMSLVSHSVERLKPENVSVVDDMGNDLSAQVIEAVFSPSSASFTANQLQLKTQYENDLARSVQSMLETMRGPGKAVVRANVEMDFDQIERVSEIFGDSVMISEHAIEESSSGTTSSGANPADANMGGPSYGTVGSDVNQANYSEHTRNYEVNKTVETQIVSPGKVTKLSLSVLIDGELTPEEQTQISDAVSKAAGIDLARGDQVSIVGMPFNNEVQEQMRQQMLEAEAALRRAEYVRMAIIIGAVLFFTGLLFFLLKKFRSSIQESAVMPLAAQYAAAGGESGLNVDIPPLEPEYTDSQKTKIQIEKLATTNPEEVAKVIKTWLVEE
ncbi:MAG: flagellar basal-body MS-ring/collar protein FliF [Peptococcia bacterium]